VVVVASGAMEASGAAQSCARHDRGAAQSCARHDRGAAQSCARHDRGAAQSCARHDRGAAQSCARHDRGAAQSCLHNRVASAPRRLAHHQRARRLGGAQPCLRQTLVALRERMDGERERMDGERERGRVWRAIVSGARVVLVVRRDGNRSVSSSRLFRNAG
jgi:hypothetical protein